LLRAPVVAPTNGIDDCCTLVISCQELFTVNCEL
jgi:hypothetical protein